MAHEVVAESKAEAVDAEDAPCAQAFECLDELGGVDVEELGEWFRLKRMLEDGGGDEDAMRPVALGVTLSKQRFRQSFRGPRSVAIGERLGDEARLAAGGVVQLRDPEGRQVVGREWLELHARVRLQTVWRVNRVTM